MTEDKKPFAVVRVCAAHPPSAEARDNGVRGTPYDGGYPQIVGTEGSADDRSWAVRYRPSVAFFTLLPLLLTAGCENRPREQARQEMREARAAIEKLKLERNKALEEVATIRAELHAVRQTRDELQKHMDQSIRERDQASMFAQQAQEAINRLTTQENYQSNTTAALQKQLAEMKTLIEEQQKLIEQLHREGAPPATTSAAQTTDALPPAEPNENP